MDDCIFCKIVNGEIPSYKVYEDKEFFAFLDIRPLNPGHTLLIPKKHYRWVNDYEPFCGYWETARKLSKIIQKALNPLTVCYSVLGLEVPHAHIHLIPRFENDGHKVGLDIKNVKNISEEEMKKIAEKISSSFK